MRRLAWINENALAFIDASIGRDNKGFGLAGLDVQLADSVEVWRCPDCQDMLEGEFWNAQCDGCGVHYVKGYWAEASDESSSVPADT